MQGNFTEAWFATASEQLEARLQLRSPVWIIRGSGLPRRLFAADILC